MEAQSTSRTVWGRLYHGQTNFQFIRRARLWFLISAAAIAIGLVSLFTRGLNLGIDFEGGTAWSVSAPGVSVAEARDALRDVGQAEAKIQIIGRDTLRVAARIEGRGDDAQEQRADRDERTDEVRDVLAELADAEPTDVSISEVGPSWGDEVTEKAQRSLVWFFVAIAAYIAWRFKSWKSAVAALTAVFHDILITVGVYSVFQFDVTPPTVIAFLTILGFSLYDTIVVFDKVDENTRGLAASGRMTYGDMVNLSMNQVLMRSLNTSVVAILPIVSLLVVGSGILGATVLREFGLALFIGLLTGAYSSIYIAAPVLARLREREPRYAAIRQRLEARGGGGGQLTPAEATSITSEANEAAAAQDAAERAAIRGEAGVGAAKRPNLVAPRARTGQPPRPRKKGRRR